MAQSFNRPTDRDDEARAVLRDLDAAAGRASDGEWSVRFARSLGWSDEEIERFLQL